MMDYTEMGFTPRYEWHGPTRVTIWRHCGQDARQGDKWVRGSDGREYRLSVLRCEVCGLNGGNNTREHLETLVRQTDEYLATGRRVP